MITLENPRVRALKDRFDNSYIGEPNSGCWLWDASFRGGSRADRPVIENEGRRLLAYRVAFELYKGPIPTGAFICHHCDVPACVNPAHLYAGSAQTNMDDRSARGRHRCAKGSAQGSSKLTDETALAVFRDQRPYTQISATYGIGLACISRIKRRTAWRHVTEAAQ